MKKIFFLFAAAAAFPLAAQNADAYSVIKNPISASKYVEGAVAEADLEKIIAAGIAAPSARNGQPWKYIIVKNAALLPKTVTDSNIPKGGVSIIVYTAGDGKSADAALDCGLTVQSMNLAAQALGYGSRIYTGSVAGINAAKADFGIPSNSSAVAVLRIGKIASRADAVSSASPRKTTKELVIYK
ncbi:MAG: nitroreductase family protein [Spirochaetaceae bacterium]|jgi:nitroreductase|nr:nitroreductase family protein [Spirochaetaceae bacterium]